MAERLFLFVQMELPWELGPPDGRYLLRRPGAPGETEPERVVVLETVGAARRHGRLAARRRPRVAPEPGPEPVPSTRATVVDPVPVSAEGQARAWLADVDPDREASATAAVLNRILFAHRLAAADPHVREVSPAQALVVRAGWGEGEQVAYGQWAHASELRTGHPRRRRAATLSPQERFAALLGGRERTMVCEELTLRARHDLDAGRLVHAALELEQAYAAALAELSPDRYPDLAVRLAELAKLQPRVLEAARAALGVGDAATPPAEWLAAHGETVDHTLGRLEAMLRARAAGGLDPR